MTIISDALDNIQRNKECELDLDNVPLDDPETYTLLARGETLGLFQLDNINLQTLLRQMKPDCFADISATIALYRPGPMAADSHTNFALRKAGLQKIVPIHPELQEPLAEILDETYGLIVYQEQVMAIAQKLAGYTLGQADILRKAMGKKKKEAIAEQAVVFFAGMEERGYSREASQALWDVMVPFAEYAFNKAHSAGYALLSFRTAYLKAHYPQEYMAALLTSVADNHSKLALYLNECRRMGITVLVPDINESVHNFAAVGEDIRFGMAAIRNVGSKVVDKIIAARHERGAFTSFMDFLQKVPLEVCNKRSIDSLIKAGAFDSVSPTRRALVDIHHEAIDMVTVTKRQEAIGQMDLFSMGMDDTDTAEEAFSLAIPEVAEWDKKEKLNFEREMLGLYVSDHPLHGLESVIAAESSVSLAELVNGEKTQNTGYTTVCGIITAIKRRVAKTSGKPYAIITLEDLAASIEIRFFGDVYEVVGPLLAEDTVVTVNGFVRADGDEQIAMVAKSMTIPDVTDRGDRPFVLRLPAERCTEEVVTQLRDILFAHRGSQEVQLQVFANTGSITVSTGAHLRVTADASLYGDIKALLGREALR